MSATAEELAHFGDVLQLLTDRWDGMPPDARLKLAALNGDPALRDEAMAEFKGAWTAADGNVDGKLSKPEFITKGHP